MFPIFRSFISPSSNVSSLPRGGGCSSSRRASTAASYANGSESQEALLPGFSDTMSLRVGTSHSSGTPNLDLNLFLNKAKKTSVTCWICKLLLFTFLLIIFLQAQIQLSIDRTLEKALLQG